MWDPASSRAGTLEASSIWIVNDRQRQDLAPRLLQRIVVLETDLLGDDRAVEHVRARVDLTERALSWEFPLGEPGLFDGLGPADEGRFPVVLLASVGALDEDGFLVASRARDLLRLRELQTEDVLDVLKMERGPRADPLKGRRWRKGGAAEENGWFRARSGAGGSPWRNHRSCRTRR